MERSEFERTQGFLSQLLRYLEALHTRLEWESDPGGREAGGGGREAAGSGGEDGEAGTEGRAGSGAGSESAELPARIARILADAGHLEGLHLKAQGLLSQELQEFIHGIGFAFELEVTFPGAFKLPFVDNEASLRRMTLNAFMEKAWMVYHGSLLSAYAMKPLRFRRDSASQDGLEAAMRVTDSAPEAGGGTKPMSPETLHILNNALMGITSYVSLILGERADDEELRSKLELVLEAARKAAASARPQ